jgi:hypothetical protein
MQIIRRTKQSMAIGGFGMGGTNASTLAYLIGASRYQSAFWEVYLGSAIASPSALC